MNKFARMLMTDGRQGVRGTGRYGIGGSRYYGRRDRADYGEDYADDRNMDYGEDYARGGRGRDRGMDYGYDMDMARGGRDRNDYGWDMARGRERGDYGEDMRRGDRASYNDYRRDYGEPEMFSHKDMETWKSMMRNEDGSRGVHFRPEQVKHACEQSGIDCEEFGDDIFCLAMNMMYSDYCKVAKKYGVDRPEYYADLAKAFLRDKDFDGKPEEKLYLYYKCIVEKDD
jgi:hypothetical protein